MDLHKSIGFSYRKYSAEAALGLFGRLGGLKSIIYNPQAIGKHTRALVSDKKNKRNQIVGNFLAIGSVLASKS